MDDDLVGDRLVHDAALVRSARRRIDEAIAKLAAQPFDEAAAAGMRRARRSSSGARAALRRVRTPPGPQTPRRPELHVVVGTVRRAGPTPMAGPTCSSGWPEKTSGGAA